MDADENDGRSRLLSSHPESNFYPVVTVMLLCIVPSLSFICDDYAHLYRWTFILPPTTHYCLSTQPLVGHGHTD